MNRLGRQPLSPLPTITILRFNKYVWTIARRNAL